MQSCILIAIVAGKNVLKSIALVPASLTVSSKPRDLRFTRLEKVRRAQSPSALEVEGPARGTELWPPRATAGTCA